MAKSSRSTMLVAIGAAVFVAGSALAFFAVRGGDDDADKADVRATGTRPQASAPGAVTAPGTANPAVAFTIPEGKQAMAVQVPFVQGGGGYAKTGDKVNVYGIFKEAPANRNLPNPAAKLVLSKVEVLAVTTPTPGAGVGNATFLLAVDAQDAEKLVYVLGHESAYLTLARDDQGPLSTPGVNPANAA